MRQQWKDGDYLFDGFCHRPYRESLDGWRNAVPDASDYPCVQQALNVIDLFEDLCEARRRIWQLEKENKQLRPLVDAYL